MCEVSFFLSDWQEEERNKKCWLRSVSKEGEQETSVSCGGEQEMDTVSRKREDWEGRRRKRPFKCSARIKCNGYPMWKTPWSPHTSHPVVFLSRYSPSYTILVFSSRQTRLDWILIIILLSFPITNEGEKRRKTSQREWTWETRWEKSTKLEQSCHYTWKDKRRMMRNVEKRCGWKKGGTFRSSSLSSDGD